MAIHIPFIYSWDDRHAVIRPDQSLQSVIYEREPFDANAERGGSLDIHEDSGQLALREAVLIESFEALARYEGEDFRLLDKSGNIYMDEVTGADEKGSRPEIDRWSPMPNILPRALKAARSGWQRTTRRRRHGRSKFEN